jgi:hypothetical protein
MLNILTGLPKNKNNDNIVCNKFATSVGYKIILGSSTMKMFCREQKIEPIIDIVKSAQTPKYLIRGIDFSSEGVITLNECYKILLGRTSDNILAIEVVNLIKKEDIINFIIGTADNGEHFFYKQNNLLPRIEVINKIIKLLKDKKIITEFI